MDFLLVFFGLTGFYSDFLLLSLFTPPFFSQLLDFPDQPLNYVLEQKE
jgi:hypothetical protein